MILLNLGLTIEINYHRPEVHSYVSTSCSKNNSKKQTFTVTGHLVPEKFPFRWNRFTAIASTLASLENFSEVDEWHFCLAGINCRNVNIFKGSKLKQVFCQSRLLRLASCPHCTRRSPFKINCISLTLFHIVHGLSIIYTAFTKI